MTTEATSGNLEEPPVPRWVGVMIAVVLVGSMAGGGALWAWSHWSQPDPKLLAEVGRSTPMLSAAPVRPVTNTILKLSTGYQVRGTEVIVLITKPATAQEWNYRFIYNKSDLLPPEEMAAITARTRLATDAAYAKFLKVSEEQITQLKELPAASTMTEMVIAPAELTKFKSLFDAYAKASNSTTEQAVVKAAQDLGASSLAPTRKSISANADKIKKILTPEQLAPFKQSP